MGSLDSLATNGIIDFDADAYIKGTAPKFVGTPNYLPGEQPLPAFNPPGQNAKLAGQPAKDAFISNEKKANSDWKKYTFFGLIAGLAALCTAKLIKTKPTVSSIGNFFKKQVDWLKSKFKKTTPAITGTPAAAPTETTAATTKTISTKAKEIFKNISEKIKALPKGVKIAGGILAGVIVLDEVYKTLFGKKTHHKG